MSVQDIVEAYETRLRERWTPDGEPKIYYIKQDYVVKYANSDACRDAIDKLGDVMKEPSPIWDNK